MPTFPSDTVHGLSADVYFGGVALRVFGDIVVSTELSILELTANDEGNINPVDVLRRGDVTRVTVPLADATGFATISGVILPFSTVVSGVSGFEILVPKAQPGDSYLDQADELRLVLRDGSMTLIAPNAVVTAVEDLTLSEENQMVWAATFTLFRTPISGVESPYKLISGSVVTGAEV